MAVKAVPVEWILTVKNTKTILIEYSNKESTMKWKWTNPVPRKKILIAKTKKRMPSSLLCADDPEWDRFFKIKDIVVAEIGVDNDTNKYR